MFQEGIEPEQEEQLREILRNNLDRCGPIQAHADTDGQTPTSDYE